MGTYDKGLQHIQDQQAQHSSGRQTQPKLGLRKHAAAAAAAASPSGPEDSGSDSPAEDAGSPGLEEVLFRNGSVGVSSASSGGSPEGSTDAAVTVTPVAAGTGAGACAGKGGQSCQEGQLTLQGVDACMWSRPKVVLWLGSSIGNCDRDQAAEFLRQVKDKTLNTGACAAPKALPVAPPIPSSSSVVVRHLLFGGGLVSVLCSVQTEPGAACVTMPGLTHSVPYCEAGGFNLLLLCQLLLAPAELMSHNESFCHPFLCYLLPSGDFLLLGIDRRNSRYTVAAAYNDTHGK